MDETDRKRLKSTSQPISSHTTLPHGWTEHTAPTGIKYYYDKATKKSTYTRPRLPVPAATPTTTVPLFNHHTSNGHLFPPPVAAAVLSPQAPQQYRKPQPQDRPKRLESITNCAPWVLVYTRLGRRFVHNTATKQSLWKFPPQVMSAVISHDGARRNINNDQPAQVEPVEQTKQEEEQEEQLEEIEVQEETDSEFEEVQQEAATVDKDQHNDELDEDDMAYQLEAMHEYEPPVTTTDPTESFHAMLDDWAINPFTPWDVVLESHPDLFTDARFTVLPSAKLRLQAHDDWSRASILAAKEKAAQTSPTIDTKTVFLAFVQSKTLLEGSGQGQQQELYWAEFKRKYKREKELSVETASPMRKLVERDREALYRAHVSRITKMSVPELEQDLLRLCRSCSRNELNRHTQLHDLPVKLTGDVRFVSLRPQARDELLKQYISTLEPPP